MKILMVGEFSRGSLCDSYCRAFKKLGCQVYCFDESLKYQEVSRYTKYRYINRILEFRFVELMNHELLKAAVDFSPDLCLIMKGQRILPRVILKIKEITRCLLFNINADDPFSENRGASSVYVRKSLKLFDCYFIWSRFLMDKLNGKGLNLVQYLPFASDSELHIPYQASLLNQEAYSNDIVFIGNWEKRREVCLGYLKDFDLGVWGGDYWYERCKDLELTSRWHGKEASVEEMCIIFNASKICLNILRKQNLGSINMRTFEIPACKGFSLVERSQEAQEFFTEDKEAVYFSTPEELRDKIKYYLEHENERTRIAQAGYQRSIAGDYSYLNRAKQVLKMYDSVKSPVRVSVSNKKYKVAVIATHIIQYAIPLYKKISAHPDIDLTIFFCSEYGLIPKLDPGFGIELKWDELNLQGLNYKFLRNYSPFQSVNVFFGLVNPEIITELRENKFDAVIIGGYSLVSFWLGFYAAWVSKTPFILTGEPPTPWKSKLRILIMGAVKKLFMPTLLKHAAAILYIGSKSKEYYLSYRKDIQDKLFFSPYSVDNEFFYRNFEALKGKREQIRKELGIPLDYPVILFLSKLIKWKRPMFLLKVFRHLKTPASLIYVGSGYRLKALKKYAEKNNIERLFFFGFKNYSEISKYYFISDVFVLPSLGETWGLVINEAMCFGLPIITTEKVMAAYDLVQHGINGYLIPASNAKVFIEVLENLINNPRQREKMGEASRKIIEKWCYNYYVEGLLKALDFIKNK